MTAASPEIERSSAEQVACWSATVLVVLLPIHVVFVDVGFSLKPWFVPLVVGLAASLPTLARTAWSLPVSIRVGVVLTLVGAGIGVLVSANQTRSIRHLVAIGIALSVMLLLMAVRRIPFIGLAFRAGALLMTSAAVVEAMLVMPAWVSVATLQKGGAMVGQLAEVAYGDIILVTGTHGDSNFSALYGAVWLFLVLAFPAERFFTRRWDGLVVGLLVLQLVLSLSKTGVVSVLVAIGATVYWYRKGDSWRNVRPGIAAGLVAFAAVSSVLLIADATDGHHDIAHGLRKRGGQVLLEADAALGLVTGEAVAPLDRAGIWKGYLQDISDHPLTGTGFGTPLTRPQYAHNAALEAAGGGGVLALAGWVTLWWALGSAAVGLVRRHREALPLLGAATVVFMGSLFLSTNYEPIVALVFALVLTPHLPQPAGDR